MLIHLLNADVNKLIVCLERVPIIDVTNVEEPLWLDWDDIDFGNMTGHMEDHNDRLIIIFYISSSRNRNNWYFW